MNDELINIDPDDISDLLLKVEKSFHIKFNHKLEEISTFGELCDHITDKIQLDNIKDCTTQQAFYKLRNALNIQDIIVSPDTLLTDILPKKDRISKVRDIEKALGYKLSILRPPHFVTSILVCLLLISIGLLFTYWQAGLSGIVLCMGGFKLSHVNGKEMDVQTVGEVAKKMVREHYTEVRRNPGTMNRKEIQEILTDWFSMETGLDKSKLNREARFF